MEEIPEHVAAQRIAAEVRSALGWSAQEPARVRGPVALPSPLAVPALAAAAVGAVAHASNLLSRAREQGEVFGDPPTLSGPRLAAAFRSEQILRIDGAPVTSWAELSGFFATTDGWIRTHANYPAHADALRGVLGLGAGAGRAEAISAIGRRESQECAEAIVAAGGVAAVVRSVSEWQEHPQARALAQLPLIDLSVSGSAPPLTRSGERPLSGVRVLDLTRVIAGPVCTRTLALLGADVLRVDSPRLPEIPAQHLDTGQGKRSTLLDLKEPADRTRFDELCASADVVVTGYRPGALARFGLEPETFQRRHTATILARIDAWGTEGPWARRRGFDSIVQAATGIAHLHAREGVPGALPAQALDHSSGYLLAAAILDALARRQRSEPLTHPHVSLARVAHTLLDAGRVAPCPAGGEIWRSETVRARSSDGADILCAAPALPGQAFTHIGGTWGQDPPAWPDHTGVPGTG